MSTSTPHPAPAPCPAAEAVLRLTVDLVARGVTPPNLDIVCRAAATALGVDGVAVTLASSSGNRAVIGGSDATARAIEAIQLTVGEGPCTEATARNTRVMARDVRDPGDARWPIFVQHLDDLPVRALSAAPLLLGAAPVGSVNFYSARAGGLDGLAASTAAELARAIVVALLALRAEDSSGAPVPYPVDTAVHQATGMVAATLRIPTADALARLRALAFVQGRMLADVSRDVVERRLAPSLD